LLRGVGDSSNSKWSVQAEQVVRETLLLFYTYLFYDIDELIAKKASEARRGSGASRGQVEAGDTFGVGDSRASFSINELLAKRRQMNDTPHIHNFLKVFVHSQMFERFCASRVTKYAKREEVFTLTDRSVVHGFVFSSSSIILF
jgi:hypothetical protein